MTAIVFEPWRGNHYEAAPFGKKLLILGESHYPWAGTPINHMRLLTQQCVQEQLNGGKPYQFWTNIAATVLGHLPKPSEKETFWNSVAFYNYIQSSVGDGPRMRPTREQWQAAWAPFTEVLEILKPKVVIALGSALWNNLPKLDGYAGPCIEKSRKEDTWHYTYPGGSCLVYGIYHPSSGRFSWSEWHRHVCRAIELS